MVLDIAGIVRRGGWLNPDQLDYLAIADRLRPVLVRCNNCRFQCAAQDAQHLIDIITSSERDWVRDVSLPAGDPAFAGDFRA